MYIKILGCSGGIGSNDSTTALHVGARTLIDAGSGLLKLSQKELIQIDTIFFTHSHLDHVLGLPLLLDSVGLARKKPLTVYALKATILSIKKHIFNNVIWPDFTKIPSAKNPVVVFKEIKALQTIRMDGFNITAVPANHSVPAIGYHVTSKKRSLIFTGDTTHCPSLITYINKLDRLDDLIIETAFLNKEVKLAELSKHYYPTLLIKDAHHMKKRPAIFITHLKPGYENAIMKEIEKGNQGLAIKRLKENQLFTL
jgi:ribonuclease BN (tRNA processing enzyme)